MKPELLQHRFQTSLGGAERALAGRRDFLEFAPGAPLSSQQLQFAADFGDQPELTSQVHGPRAAGEPKTKSPVTA